MKRRSFFVKGTISGIGMTDTLITPTSCRKSLRSLLGQEYMDAVVRSASYLYGMDEKEACALASQEFDFYPKAFEDRIDAFLPFVGQSVAAPFENTMQGAATDSFSKASHIKASPMGGIGYLKLGEDGRFYLSAKSEHYHAPLGHAFPGHRLLDNARILGITNATHNNTRGYITRLLETELVCAANGLTGSDQSQLETILCSTQPQVLNRVINLETGSLACEAGLKMMLARFYRNDKTSAEPVYGGRTPVFFVMGDNDGGTAANYHGTTVLAQTLRGLWPSFYEKVQENEAYFICPVRINDIDDFEKKLRRYNTGKYKTAGFIHEIVLMNYGGILLDLAYMQKAYALCHESDTPVMADEIQTGAWYPELFLFREFGLSPDFVVIGKGFPGGQYPASRILTTAAMDNLNQFGALVTNGQEELASLSYLITMEFVKHNQQHIKAAGEYYCAQLSLLCQKYDCYIEKIEGLGLLSSLCFRDVDSAVRFAQQLNAQGVEVGIQTYKPKCPPAVLTKLPLISTGRMIDELIRRMDQVLCSLQTSTAL